MSAAADGDPPKVFIVSRDTECGECGKALPQ
jgi:hypothetical protein